MKNFKFLISLLLILAFGATSAMAIYTNSAVYTEAAASEQPTLRDKLSQPVPMVSSMEVVGYHDSVYVLANVNGDEQDMGNYALTGEYKLGDVVTLLWATEDSTEIAGETLVGTADELELPHGKN
ncbi:hypothetical protein CN926_00640 [Bacillus thuringiensis]|uniref:hypothetical protein n=1 Tax=Bacillus thuringiensis TaxID=1428 RepID=UPI000BFDD3B2|nr:hypothetical protein [Bacillus thuringiensis]PGL88544.1 hypothetical protein CN926_00640 [Bacillus thuringiensis]PGM47427.1 hypothetical protein CN937_03910 [Bacillus thuringiensis]